MLPLFAEITVEDVLLLDGPEYLLDKIWRAQFGKPIDHQYRIVPRQLLYLLNKYGRVVPHESFVESIQEVCAKYQQKPDSNEMIRVLLSPEAAGRLIEEAARLGLITALRPPRDRRYKLWVLTPEQKRNLHKIAKAARLIDAVIDAQLSDPTNPRAGLTDENKEWHGNVITDMTMRKDEAYRKEKEKLDRLQYLLQLLFIVAVGASVFLAPVLALADFAGGTK
jgi:DNA-binding MarR family transcriptional regulator